MAEQQKQWDVTIKHKMFPNGKKVVRVEAPTNWDAKITAIRQEWGKVIHSIADQCSAKQVK